MRPGFAHPPEISTAQRRRKSCLSGCLLQIIAIFALGGVLYLAITAVFAPWAFYMGGSFHILPDWQGWGKLQGPGGQYVLLVQVWPTPRGSRVIPHSNLTGTAYLCTPRGERFTMKLGGSMRFGLGRSTNGEEIYLYMHNWTWNRTFVNRHPPAVTLHGRWQNPNIVADDEGSFRRAFNPDGSVIQNGFKGIYQQTAAAITLMEGSKSDFDAACRANH
jgi:hypothetical protein